MGEKIIVGVGSVGAALLVAYVGHMFWETRQLEQLCTDVRPGSPASAIAPLAEAHGFSRMVTTRLQEGVWQSFVIAPSTMGDDTCEIVYDRDVVRSAQLHSK